MWVGGPVKGGKISSGSTACSGGAGPSRPESLQLAGPLPNEQAGTGGAAVFVFFFNVTDFREGKGGGEREREKHQ